MTEIRDEKSLTRLDAFAEDDCVGPKLKRIIARFLASHRSQQTRNAYSRDLRNFFLFCWNFLGLRVISLNQITERLVLAWQKSLIAGSPKTEARRLSALSSFLAFACDRKMLTHNVMENLHRPKPAAESKTNVLTYDEVQTLLSFAEKKIISCQSSRRFFSAWKLKYAILYTLFTVGLRVEELCRLKISGLKQEGDNYRLSFMAKGNEEHSLFINRKTAAVLIAYRNEFRAQATADDFFFVRSQQNQKTTALSRSTVFSIVSASAREAGLDKKISPHSCRATLATLLHQRGVPIGEIQSLLNHKQITTTSIYIKKSNEIEHSASRKINFFYGFKKES